jgi:hypothetical protein
VFVHRSVTEASEEERDACLAFLRASEKSLKRMQGVCSGIGAKGLEDGLEVGDGGVGREEMLEERCRLLQVQLDATKSVSGVYEGCINSKLGSGSQAAMSELRKLAFEAGARAKSEEIRREEESEHLCGALRRSVAELASVKSTAAATEEALRAEIQVCRSRIEEERAKGKNASKGLELASASQSEIGKVMRGAARSLMGMMGAFDPSGSLGAAYEKLSTLERRLAFGER